MNDELSEYEKAEEVRYKSGKPEDRLRIANAVNDQLFQITASKLATLPIISAIAAALLVVASFNENLLPLNIIVRLLISLLMLIVPVSLLFYVAYISRIEKLGIRLMTKVYKAPLVVDGSKKLDKITHNLPWIVSWTLFIVVLTILCVMWFPSHRVMHHYWISSRNQ